MSLSQTAHGSAPLCFLLLQAEGSLDAREFVGESLVYLEALLDGVAGMDDGRVVTVSDKLSDA